MSAPASTSPRRRRRLLPLLPLALFGGLAGVFLFQLLSGHDPQTLPSALIGQPAPRTELPPLPGLLRADGTPVPGIGAASVGPRLVNVFASWCGPCRQEHPLLLAMARDPELRAAGLRIEGLNYKDRSDNALGFLRELGNPYDAVGVDEVGRATIDWGVYGVPETFLVSPDGTILWKQTGPLTPQAVTGGLLPALRQSAAAK